VVRVSREGDVVAAANVPVAAKAPPPAIAPFDAEQAQAHQQAWAKHLGGSIVTTNKLGMKLVLIPPGKFVMGAADNEPGYEAREGPQHDVTITGRSPWACTR